MTNKILITFLSIAIASLTNACAKIDTNYIGEKVPVSNGLIKRQNTKPSEWKWLKTLTDDSAPYFATAVNYKSIALLTGMGTDVTVELKDDQCIYYRYPNGELILPVFTNGFATPDQISRYFQNKVNKTLTKAITFDIDKNSDYSTNSEKWMSLSSKEHCKYGDKVKMDYFTLSHIVMYNEYTEYKDKGVEIYPNSDLESLPSYDGKERFVSIFNEDITDNKRDKIKTGKLQIDDNKCMYLYDKKGEKSSLIFTGNKVYWDDSKESINVDGQYISLDKDYNFKLSGEYNFGNNEYYSSFNRERIVRKPNSICDNSAMKYVKSISAL